MGIWRIILILVSLGTFGSGSNYNEEKFKFYYDFKSIIEHEAN
ncbi:hypothetical protein [Sulfurovum sp. bin170]|nr:hypothetical protein [Sulfurovum sp. bin170]